MLQVSPEPLLLRSSRKQPQLLMLDMNLRQVKSEVQKVQTLRSDVKPGEDTDEMNACLTET